jgi:hypothetical protein
MLNAENIEVSGFEDDTVDIDCYEFVPSMEAACFGKFSSASLQLHRHTAILHLGCSRLPTVDGK